MEGPVRRRVVLAVAATAISALVALRLSTPRSGDDARVRRTAPDGGEAVLPDGEPPSGSPALHGTRSPPPAAPRTPPTPPAEAARHRHAILEIHVRDLRGRPAAGATVRAYGLYEWDREPSRASIRAAGETDAEGRLDLAVPVSPDEMAWPGPILVHAYLADTAALSEVLDPWAPDPADVGRREVRLELAEGFVVSGRVSSDAGAPISGATVEAGDPETLLLETRTEADGTYRFPPVPAGGWASSIEIRGQAAGHAAAAARTEAAAKGTALVPLLLPLLRTVSGRGVDASGGPVAADLFATGVGGVRTGESGEFLFRVPRRGGEIAFLPDPPFAPRTLLVPAEAPADLGSVVFDTGGRIRGQIVVGPDVRGLQADFGWWIECRSLAVRGAVRVVQADGDGMFEVQGVGPGEHVLLTSWGSHVPQMPVASGETAGVRAGDLDVRLVVHGSGVVRLRPHTASDEHEIPVRAWRVEAVGPWPDATLTVRSAPDRGRDLTEGEEGFAVGLPRPGLYRLRVKIGGYAWAEAGQVDVGAFVGAFEREPREIVVASERR